MNAVIKAIMKRRSVKSYESKPIPRDIINMIIKEGRIVKLLKAIDSAVMTMDPFCSY